MAAQIIIAVNRLVIAQIAAEKNIPTPNIDSSNWAQIKADLGAAAAKAEQRFDIQIWTAMRQRGDAQYAFIRVESGPDQPVRTINIQPPSGCKTCGKSRSK